MCTVSGDRVPVRVACTGIRYLLGRRTIWWPPTSAPRVGNLARRPPLREHRDPGTPAGRQQYALAQLTGMGLSNVQAAAMVAEFKQESGLNPNTKPGDSGTAFGIEQLRGDRLNLFRQHMGKDVQHSSLDEQLRYAVWELQNGDPQTRAAGDRFLHSTNIGEAVRAFTGVERPADTAKRNYLASDDAAGILRNMPTAAVINQTTNITVNGSTEPGKTADEIARRQSQVNQAVTRNVAGAVQ